MSRVLPILFNPEMVRAILDDRKTTTRRVIKKTQCNGLVKITPREWIEDKEYLEEPWCSMTDKELINSVYNPPYRIGDILYVRETWCNANKESVEPDYYYYADTFLYEDYDRSEWKWRPSIHMPKDAARIWLRVTDVRVERLQDISGEELMKEGVDRSLLFDGCVKVAFDKFKQIWNSTIKKRDIEQYGWDATPWVWVIEFERCEKPEE